MNAHDVIGRQKNRPLPDDLVSNSAFNVTSPDDNDLIPDGGNFCDDIDNLRAAYVTTVAPPIAPQMTDDDIVRDNIIPESHKVALGMFHRNPEFLSNV